MRARRTLALGLLSILLLSSLGAATPIVVPPVPEKLVEGHTVFGLIDIVSVVNETEAEFAAAVAVLVREYQAKHRAARFPGVLWFNDQYLTDPYQAEDDAYPGRRSAGRNAEWRYPCGGAVLAVNAGDPDPRVAIAQMNGTYPTHPLVDRRFNGSSYEQYPAGSDQDGNNFSWIDLEFNLTDPTNPYARAYSDTLRTGSQYEKSYSITDPNDHNWVIDVYKFYQRDHFPSPLNVRGMYEYRVWVVNMLGTAAYVPDDPELSCLPFADLLSGRVLSPLCQNADDVQGDDGLPLDCTQSFLYDRGCNGRILGNGYDTGAAEPGYLGSSPYADDPCKDYREPSRNGYCYGGQAPSSTSGCADRAETPLRTYNALLYFELKDLKVPDAPRDHSDPTNSTDTNGCYEPGSAAWASPDEYGCPAGDDDAEGNSHPFHPLTPTHKHDGTKCPDLFRGPNPTNHGGSTDPEARCDYVHATRNIDIYFGSRPAPPVGRRNAVSDSQGSNAPFHDHHLAYPSQP